MTANPARTPSTGIVVASCLLLAAATAALLSSFWIGFIASDDIFYIRGAQGWLENFPYVGTSHWTLRHTITVPLAVLIGWFGLQEWVLGVPTVLAFTAFLATNAYFATRLLDFRVAVVATALMLVAPGITVVATYLIPDVPELFFVSTAFWLLVAARQNDDSSLRWVLIGLLAGLGFVNRETSAAFPLFAGLAFLFAPGARRVRYFIALAAFVAVVGTEWAYITSMTGEPLYRARIATSAEPITRAMEMAHAKGGLFDGDGNISVNVWLDPVLNLVISQKYPLLFWLAAPAAVIAWRQRRTQQGQVMLMVLGLGLVSFVFIGYNPKLLLVKRYFMLVAWTMAMLGAWGVVYCWDSGRRKWAVVGLSAALLAGVTAMSVERTNPRMAERELVNWVRANPGTTIHTAPEVYIRADYYFQFAGVSRATVIPAAPPSGSLYYYCAECVVRCATSNRTGNRCGPRPEDYVPKPDWLVQQKIEGQRRPVARLVAALGLQQALPPAIAKKLMAQAEGAVIYRLP
jgi:4-amino-4-deoxy-L-arabinose transferase-like glycosyltransferase